MQYIIVFFIMLILSVYIFFKYMDKRSLIFGFLFLLWLGIFLLVLAYLIFAYNLRFLISLFAVGFISILILFIFSPVILIIVLLYNGYLLIKKEGFSLSHSLAFFSGIGLILYFLAFPYIFNDRGSVFTFMIYSTISFIVFYMVMLVSIYLVSSILNLIHFKVKNLDYVIVLGSGLIKDKVTPLLAGRIDKGISVLNKQSNNCKIIFSGGQGEDEEISEALAMYNYAVSKGINKDRCIIEDKSKNTDENLKFSYEKIEDKNSKICIVTNNFHVFRSLIIAKKQNIKCIGIGSRSKFYYSLNAFIREFIGYLYISKKFHTTVITIFVVFINLFLLVLNIIN